jgi:D-alanyl-D-alanine dipeptidase
MKPYQTVAIQDNQEALVAIPADSFDLVNPHPYIKLGAPYGSRSPFYVRQSVLERLQQAQTHLQQKHPGWKIQIFDAYRPVAVQQFMVDYTFQELVQLQNLVPEDLTEAQRHRILNQVYEFWAVPNPDPSCPPPHSTGAAVDVTLVDAEGNVVNMGSPIDETSPRSYPDHFATRPTPQEQQYHHHREILRQAMTAAGFCQHPKEWWHFSYGDQMWAWQMNRCLIDQSSSDQTPEPSNVNPANAESADVQPAIAQYGRVPSE